jgi:hypothetical protein
MTPQTELRRFYPEEHWIVVFVMRIVAGKTGHLSLLAQRQSCHLHGRDNVDLVLIRALPVRMAFQAQTGKRRSQSGSFGIDRDMTIAAFMLRTGKRTARSHNADDTYKKSRLHGILLLYYQFISFTVILGRGLR